MSALHKTPGARGASNATSIAHESALARRFPPLLLVAKRIVVALGLGDLLIEFCEDCGVEQPVAWWAADSLWAALHGPDDGGAYCPRCFSLRAARAGLLLRWTPTVREVG